MDKIPEKHVKKLEKFISGLRQQKTSPNRELDFGSLCKMMRNLGFEGPINKSGSAKAFSHELLRSEKMLTEGTFTVHIFNPKRNTIIYYDFKRYMVEYIEIVIIKLEEHDLLTKDDEEHHV